MPVKTSDVRARIIGEARKAIADAAGPNGILSKAEQATLPADLARAADAARKSHPRLTAGDAVDAYAARVAKALAAVDTRAKGTLSEAEANRIRDTALRHKVVDARAALLSGDVPGGQRPSTAQVLAALNGPVDALAEWHDSGDNGVNVTVSELEGVHSMTEAFAAVTTDDATPWTTYEHDLNVTPLRGTAAIDAFTSDAVASLVDFKPEGSDAAQAFAGAVTTTFGKLRDVRLASGGDLGGSYLIGKTRDGYVAVVSQGYHDG